MACRAHNYPGRVSMADVIEFLERMGRDAGLRQASPDQLEKTLIDAEIPPQMQAAIPTHDSARLNTLLGQSSVCMIYLPGKPAEEEETEEEDGDEETPPKEPDERRLHLDVHILAASA